MAQPKRLRDALDRNLAGYAVVTTAAVQPKNPGDDQATALAVVLVDETGAPSGTGSAASPSVISSAPFNVASQFTRPADTTPYTAGDVVGGVLTFSAVAASTKTVMIDNVDLRIDLAAIPSGMTSFTLQLYSATPPSALADNAVWDLPSGDRTVYVGSIPVGNPVDLGSTLYIKQTGLTFQCAPAATALYGYLVTTGAWTPAASTVFAPVIHGFAV